PAFLDLLVPSAVVWPAFLTSLLFNPWCVSFPENTVNSRSLPSASTTSPPLTPSPLTLNAPSSASSNTISSGGGGCLLWSSSSARFISCFSALNGLRSRCCLGPRSPPGPCRCRCRTDSRMFSLPCGLEGRAVPAVSLGAGGPWPLGGGGPLKGGCGPP